MRDPPVRERPAPDPAAPPGAVASPENLAIAPPRRWARADAAVLSALLPGAGQVAQGRLGMAVIQGATVAGYAAAALAAGGGEALWIALAWNVWSAVDAYRSEEG